MKKEVSLLLLNLLLITASSFAQDNFLIGKWKYEKIPDHIVVDEQGLKMANDFFKDMTLSFDQTNYTQIVMGKSESGTWTSINENVYEFISSKGYKYEVEIKKISARQIIFKQQNREWQLIKSDEKATIEVQINSLDKIDGIDIIEQDILGKWFHNGQIKNGKANDIILKHNESELVNFTFLKNGEFINKAPLEIELIANWKIDDDRKILIIKNEFTSEFFKIVKLSDSELHLYNPKNETILKFKR